MSSTILHTNCLASMDNHHGNKSVKCIPPYTPFLYSKTGVYRGIHFFLIFALKHRLWVLVCVPTVNVLSENNKKKKHQNFSFENYHFYSCEILLYIAWACLCNVCVYAGRTGCTFVGFIVLQIDSS